MIRRIAFLLLGLLAASYSASSAVTQFGVRGGWTHAEGSIFEGSGGIGGEGVYGFVGSFTLLPSVELEFAYERYRNEFGFSEAVFENTFFGGDGTYKYQAYVFTGKIHLPPLVRPFGLYAGGGGSLHEIDLDVEPTSGSSTTSLNDYIDQLEDERNEWEWHLVGGARLKIPRVPFLLYGEYRYQDVTGKHTPSYSSVYGGLNLFFN